jgi:hypothetical protein
MSGDALVVRPDPAWDRLGLALGPLPDVRAGILGVLERVLGGVMERSIGPLSVMWMPPAGPDP